MPSAVPCPLVAKAPVLQMVHHRLKLPVVTNGLINVSPHGVWPPSDWYLVLDGLEPFKCPPQIDRCWSCIRQDLMRLLSINLT